jgi:hypothetical protein
LATVSAMGDPLTLVLRHGGIMRIGRADCQALLEMTVPCGFASHRAVFHLRWKESNVTNAAFGLPIGGVALVLLFQHLQPNGSGPSVAVSKS